MTDHKAFEALAARSAALEHRLTEISGELAAIRTAAAALEETAPAPALAAYIATAVEESIATPEFYEAVQQHADRLTPVETCQFYFALVERFDRDGNRHMVQDTLAELEEILPAEAMGLRARHVGWLLRIGETDWALRALLRGSIQGCTPHLSAAEAARLGDLLSDFGGSDKEHGHSLLLAYFAKQAPGALEGRRLIEIGTTRESIPGQGSTLKLGRVCRQQGMQMITVDMDPRNSDRARRSFARQGWPFEAVTSKGEDYLAAYEGTIDYVFLDAYDFDHGKHSEIRQSRYEKFLGDRIDETACHRMHLDCAETLRTKLAPEGLICIDDTWRDKAGNWTAKGTLAVPYLLENGFELIEARNRAVLLRRAG